MKRILLDSTEEFETLQNAILEEGKQKGTFSLSTLRYAPEQPEYENGKIKLIILAECEDFDCLNGYEILQ